MITAPIINILKDIQLTDNEKTIFFLLIYILILGTGIGFLKRILYFRHRKEKPKDEKTT